MLSYQAMADLQFGQRLPGETMLSPFGTRAMTTLRKLPTTAPTRNTHSWNATGSPSASDCITRSRPCRGRARRKALPASDGAA